jgi:hypothetical protein
MIDGRHDPQPIGLACPLEDLLGFGDRHELVIS